MQVWLAESLQDCALLQAAFPPEAPEPAAIRDFAVFPRSSAWIASVRTLPGWGR